MDVGQTDIHPGGSVVICAFSLERVHQTVACVESVLGQRAAPAQVLVVVDHNDTLQAMLRARLPTTVQVIANSGPRGLASARNTGVQACHYDPIVFIDDDAVANENWLETLLAAFDDPEVIGAGGHAVPRWEAHQPRWLPDELLWVVGCSYRGLPRAGAVRNPLGCNMAFRAAVFKQAGPFDPGIGRLGSRPLGCEETEFCIRAVRRLPAGKFVLVPGAEVEHAVASRRGRPGYLLRRCFYEGVSKALVCKLGDTHSLDTERDYVRRTLRERLTASTKAALTGTDAAASIGQIGAVAGALTAAGIGYFVGTVVFAVRPPAAPAATNTHSCETSRSLDRIRDGFARRRSGAPGAG
jgi:GT2 family glycosyltransferase